MATKKKKPTKAKKAETKTKKKGKSPAVKRAKDSTLDTIRKAMKACKKQGIEITDGAWGVQFDKSLGYFRASKYGNPKVCALGALLVHKNGSIKFDKFFGNRPLNEIEEVETAALVLGVDEGWVEVFIDGFDGASPLDHSLAQTKDCKDCKREEEDLDFWCERDHAGDWTWIKPENDEQRELLRAFKMGMKLREEFI